MTTVKIHSGCPYGIESRMVTVEVDLRRKGLPAFALVGLPDTSIKESKERVLAAIRNCGIKFPSAKITVNLAPADFKKEGPEFDLPIACGILALDGHTAKEGEAISGIFKRYVFAGELGLDGALRPIRGALALALQAKEKGFSGIVLPEGNKEEAALASGIEVISCKSLQEVIHWVRDLLPIPPYQLPEDFWQNHLESGSTNGHSQSVDFSDILGNSLAKKALEIAAAGGHHVLLVGPPGVGKTLLARAFWGLLPPLSLEESVELTKIYSLCGLQDSRPSLVVRRPFRSPHHTASDIAVIGGGTHALPGEASLAHRGVLFLDEMAEFNRNVLEALRQPLEEGEVSVSRAAGRFRYPARFQMIGASNPCPCGWLGSKEKDCNCPPGHIFRYRRKFSGPILDRMDVHVEVQAQEFREIVSGKGNLLPSESTSQIRERVLAARKIQKERFQSPSKLNAHMNIKDLKVYGKLDKEEEIWLADVMKKFHLSPRAYHRILKVARTMADLGGREKIEKGDLSLAVRMRCLDREAEYA